MAQRPFAFGPVDESSEQQLARCLERGGEGARGVLCADHHKGYSMPIGGVLALQSVVMPAGVGYDIACGNCAVRTNLSVQEMRSDVPPIMDEIWRTISFGVGRTNDEPIAQHPVFDAIQRSPVGWQRSMLPMARAQLGTVGSGNHYVDLFEHGSDGTLWVGVHFGSRGFGHRTACGFLALAEGKPRDARVNHSMDAPPVTIPLGTPLADDYLAAMSVAGEYAYAGREWVIDRVLKILGAEDTFRVHNHHNYAWWEEHHGEKWLVVRKGATPAFPGQYGFVGGSMGDDAVIIRGRDTDTSKRALYSTVHGAGRVMGRREAKRRVDWPAWRARLRDEHIELRGGGADESPECYKRLADVLAHHGRTIEVLHTLRPIGVAMAGRDTFDPYRD